MSNSSRKGDQRGKVIGGTRQLTVGIYSSIADDDDDADEDCDNANLAQTFLLFFIIFLPTPG